MRVQVEVALLKLGVPYAAIQTMSEERAIMYVAVLSEAEKEEADRLKAQMQ